MEHSIKIENNGTTEKHACIEKAASLKTQMNKTPHLIS
jgi:hypothetical protein